MLNDELENYQSNFEEVIRNIRQKDPLNQGLFGNLAKNKNIIGIRLYHLPVYLNTLEVILIRILWVLFSKVVLMENLCGILHQVIFPKI